MNTDLERLLAGWEQGPATAEAAHNLVSAAAATLPDAALPQPASALRRFLGVTRKPDFLCALPDADAREEWFETCLAVVDAIGFDLGDLLEQRADEAPDHILFRTHIGADRDDWSFLRVRELARATAAVLWRDGPPPRLADDVANPVPGPRVGILCNNGLASAVCDLACLTEGILVAPLNIHFKEEHLGWIFDRLVLTVAICDNADRLDQLIALRDKVKRPFVIYTLMSDPRVGRPGIKRLEAERSPLGAAEIDGILSDRPRRNLRDPATVMFTSGSTGLPKGVAFTQRNLVSKRFARAAALPTVGRDEVLLCYLPLFHTFGRFLEMLGSIFWGGTYIFADNPSADSLLDMLGKVAPTGLISVPVRWQQIAERVWEITRGEDADQDLGVHLRNLVGARLRWGISAAGYLDPKVFRFFHRHDIKLCSGFGMTEGTGGLTMTPPDDYVPDSVGIPLPGTRIRLAQSGELQVSGCYIARYLEPAAPNGSLEVPRPRSDDWWLATGDLFRSTGDNHLEIVDRIKDIYKNNKGQTIAPRAVESLFEQVPGIRRTFLAGDGRAYNTLLIVPEPADDILQSLQDEEGRRHYFQHIIAASNSALSPWERVVNFAILDRDFSADHGELTPKGSLRRKTIETNFASAIGDMYRSNDRILECNGLRVRIPRWFFRDLGLLEDAITTDGPRLINTGNGQTLPIAQAGGTRVRIGDLGYDLGGDGGTPPLIDLGLFVRHPLLWIANPSLIRFSPCRTGWNTDLQGIAPHVHLPVRPEETDPECLVPVTVEPTLAEVNHQCTQALFGAAEAAIVAIFQLDAALKRAHGPLVEVIRSRLQTLAEHPVQEVRCRAFQILMLDDPHPDYQRHLPVFIESGLPFLDQESFKAISHASLHPHDLTALRKRLAYYRHRLDWPADDRTRTIFGDLLRMLADFGRYHLEFYSAIRAELFSWIRHHEDAELSRLADTIMAELGAWFETRMHAGYAGLDPALWEGKIAFQEGLNARESSRLEDVLVGTTFLRESLYLAFEGEASLLDEIGPGGIWVSRIISRFEDSRFRVSINTQTGKHFDLQLILFHNLEEESIEETVNWYLTLSGCTEERPVVPVFGSSRTDLGALTMAYTSDLTVWEKIREFSSTRGPGTRLPSRMRWRQLLVRAMSVVIRGWQHSGRRIIPGRISPYNIVVPEPDFRTGALLNNLTGWQPYDGPLSLLRPLWRNMLHHTLCHYPWTDFYIDKTWLFDAVVEALGMDEAGRWLGEFSASLQADSAAVATAMWPEFTQDLTAFLERLEAGYHPPLAIEGAIERYDEWDRINPEAPIQARLEIVQELLSLYRLDRLPEIARFTLYRRTIFHRLGGKAETLFGRLLEHMHRTPDRRASSMVELSELQSELTGPDERLAFTRMAFPHWTRDQRVEIKTLGEAGHSKVVVHSTMTDRKGIVYTVGEPTSPSEVGFLYRLFLQAGFPKTVSPQDRHLVVLDQSEQIVAGALFRPLDEETVFLDGVVVNRALAERGIAAGIMDEFSIRMKAAGVRTIRTQFFLRRFYEKHGFRVDPTGGGLVRHL
ncbi:hypothetical protein CO151_11865 [bacterium CG_4_9_14_3_um_filter_65_15]|nr:MAG: hypothetical protein CO151_11865 [bacterium CG_4_9_14_3_um_filter_65_15]